MCFSLFLMTLTAVSQIIPEHAQYRKDVEAISNYRLKVATETEDVRRSEERVGGGGRPGGEGSNFV